MLAKFMKDAIRKMLLRCSAWSAFGFGLIAAFVLFGIVTAAGDPRGLVPVVLYAAVLSFAPGVIGGFRLQRAVRAAWRTRKAEVEDCLSEWGEVAEVRASLDQEMAHDAQHLYIDELCPVMVTASWAVQVSQYGLHLVRIDAIRGFRVTFRPIPPFTSVGDYYIVLRLDGHKPQAFLIDKDHHLDQFLAELISANRHLGGLFEEDYIHFPKGLTGRDIMSGSHDQNPLSRSEVGTYIQERVDRMRNSNERTWELG
jgi:hypothetical protein